MIRYFLPVNLSLHISEFQIVILNTDKSTCVCALFVEYIVVFNGYYSTSVRDDLVTAALGSVSINSWKIIPRHNPASHYPSDFSLVKVRKLTLKNEQDRITRFKNSR